MGEVDVPNVALTMNKTDFDRDGQAWVAVEARMHKLLASWVRRLARDVEVPPPSSAIKVAEQVRRLLSQALRLSDRQDLFAGFAPARPSSKPREAPELPLEPQEPVMTDHEPRTPPPSPPDAPPDARKRGFGIIALRPLDPRVRSMTVLEDGVRTVVINSRYPLFLERRGDVWYQLETAAREICKSAEANSVAEYEKRVTDLNALFHTFPTEPMVLHLSGFEMDVGQWKPRIFFIRNTTALLPSGAYVVGNQFDCSEEITQPYYFGADSGNVIRGKVTFPQYFSFRQGYSLGTFNTIDAALRLSMDTLVQGGLQPVPTTLTDLADRMKFQIHGYGAYFAAFYTPFEQYVGGGADVVTAAWP